MTTKNDKEIKSVKKPKKIDSNQDIELIKSLESIGISQNEAIVYIYLLRRGVEVGGSKIALGTQIHRQYVYVTLNKLIELGLVITIKQGVNSKYKAVGPSQIEKIAKKKIDTASDVAEKLSHISKLGQEQDFEILIGEKAIVDLEYEWASEKRDKDEQYIIGGNTDGFSKIMGDHLDAYLKYEFDNNITTYYIGHTSEAKSWYNSDTAYKNIKVKLIDKLPQGVSHFVVRKNKVLFFTFVNPPTVYVIKSERVAQNYKDFFMMLWEMIDEKK